MRVVIQRVDQCTLTINHRTKRKIDKGLLVLLGIHEQDTKIDVEWLVGKILHLRIFEDELQKMNRSLLDIEGELMLISQFTLYASTKKGNRPSFIKAAPPARAIPLYEYMIEQLALTLSDKLKTGKFGAHMDINLINNGPVTIIIDSIQKE